MQRLIDQKELCMLIKDGFTRVGTASLIESNTEYTCVTVTRTAPWPNIVECVKSIVESDGYRLYMPTQTQPDRFIAVIGDQFADIKVQYHYKEKKNIYQILIYVSTTSIEHEWWYDRFIETI